MNQSLLLQLKMARDWTIEVAVSCTEELAVVVPDGCNNSLLWHVGHILTVAERLVFEYPRQSSVLPVDFTHWFESGTSPSDFNNQVPRLHELITLLREQQARLLAIPSERLFDPFEQLRYSFTSLAQCAGFVAIHETLHVGKMEEILRVARYYNKFTS